MLGLLAQLAFAGGCRQIAGYDPAGVAPDLGADGAADVSLVRDAGDAPDLVTSPDLGADLGADARAVPTCATPPGADLLARYTFDEQVANDWSCQPVGGGATLIVLGDTTAASWSDSAASGGCGKALALTQPKVQFKANTYGVIPKSIKPASATIEVWVRFGRTGFEEGILSRDASGAPDPGHLSLQRNVDGRVWARLQKDNKTAAHVCATQLVPHGQWVHIRLDYGQPTKELVLYVDGVRAMHSNSFVTWPTTGPYTVTCGDSDVIDANPSQTPNPWSVGASGHNGLNGSAGNSSDQLVGEIDEIRFYKARLPPLGGPANP
jgi:hypothetical protein